MAKSKDQKRQEALSRLKARISTQERPASFDQRMELQALTQPKRKLSPIEQLFSPGDPVTGTIWSDPLPADFEPTPELDEIVRRLQSRTHSSRVIFAETLVSLDCPEGYAYPTYLGGGNYLDQWVQRHTDFQLHHSHPHSGVKWRVVFCRKGNLPSYNEHDRRLGGITREEYDRDRFLYYDRKEAIMIPG